MEFVAYTVMAGGAYAALVTKRTSVVYGWFITFVLYSVAARLSPEITSDMTRYYAASRAWPSPSFYTLREPVLWYGASFLYLVLGKETLVFLAIDVMNALAVFHSMKMLDSADHRMVAIVPTILSSYVLVLGQQNGYRQYTSFVFLLWSIALCIRHRRLSFLFFVVSFLTHNVTAVFFGYWLDAARTKGRRYGPMVTVCGVIALVVLWPLLRKSSSYSGIDTSYWYIAIAVAVVLLVAYSAIGRLVGRGGPTFGLYNFLAFSPAIWVLASDQFERVAMYFLLLILLDLRRPGRRLPFRGTLVDSASFMILVVPVFMFANVYDKLM